MDSPQAKISFFIYSLDFLSGSKNFKIFDREKNVSLVGLIFTIILGVLTIFYAAVEIINYFHQINFTMISMEDNSEKIDATRYIGNETFVAIRFFRYGEDEEGNYIEESIPDLLKIFKFKLKQYNYEYENDYDEYITYSMQNCSNLFTDDDLLKFNLYSYSYIIPQSVCPPKDKGLKLRWNKQGLSELYFKVLLCDQTEDPNCYSKDEIEQKYIDGELDYIQFGFIQEYGTVDNYNHSSPVIIDVLMSNGEIDLNTNFVGETKSKFVLYESDDGIIFSKSKNYTGLRYDTFSYSYKDRKDELDFETSLISITYSINMNYVQYYKRTYIKLTAVIVDISGIARTIFFAGGMVISLLSQNYFSYKLFDEIFSQKYRASYTNEVNKNIQINENVSQNSSNKNMIKDNKINIYDSPENSSKIGSENNFLKIKTKKRRVKKGKPKSNIMGSTNMVINDVSSDITNVKGMDKDNNVAKKVDDEKYSMILSQYLGYNAKNKKRFSFWNFIFSQFYKKNNNNKIIDSCAKIINNYLSLEQIINNGINNDILLTHYESQEFNNMDAFNRIIDDDFKKTIKNIKEKKE